MMVMRTIVIMVMVVMLAVRVVMVVTMPVVMGMPIGFVLGIVSLLVSTSLHGLLKILRAVGVIVVFAEGPLVQQRIALVDARL